jgi:hypothetical protein
MRREDGLTKLSRGSNHLRATQRAVSRGCRGTCGASHTAVGLVAVRAQMCHVMVTDHRFGISTLNRAKDNLARIFRKKSHKGKLAVIYIWAIQYVR